jgi:hypothetical protein
MRTLSTKLAIGSITLLVGTVAFAQMQAHGGGAPAAAQPADATPAGMFRDIHALRSQVKTLTMQVQTLQAQVHEVNSAQVTFNCRDSVTSANNKGITEVCVPYICAPIDGRCKVTCATSADCASGSTCHDDKLCY